MYTSRRLSSKGAKNVAICNDDYSTLRAARRANEAGLDEQRQTSGAAQGRAGAASSLGSRRAYGLAASVRWAAWRTASAHGRGLLL